MHRLFGLLILGITIIGTIIFYVYQRPLPAYSFPVLFFIVGISIAGWVYYLQPQKPDPELPINDSPDKPDLSIPRVLDMEDNKLLPNLLNSEQLYIMQQLFKEVFRIRIKPLQETGYNNFGIFQVIVEHRRNIPNTNSFFVKFLRQENILKEKSVHEDDSMFKASSLGHSPGKPVRSWPADNLIVEGQLGAIVYQWASLSPRHPKTLKGLYEQYQFETIAPYLKQLFDQLEPWHTRDLPIKNGSLGGEDGVYNRLIRRKGDIQAGILNLIKSSDNSHSITSLNDLTTTVSIKLPFLPEPWIQQDFHNPIHWINNVLERESIDFLRQTGRFTAVHGDLHAGNVLIEEGDRSHRVWLIDFANAHAGPVLEDFATMEADVKFNLINIQLDFR